MRWAILKHTLPDGCWHLDLFLERPDGTSLLSFRIPAGPSLPVFPAPVTLAVTRTPDHRPHYLTYEGPVSGDRGLVTRLASGTGTWLGVASDHLTAHLSTEAAQFRLAGRHLEADTWQLTLTDLSSPQPEPTD